MLDPNSLHGIIPPMCTPLTADGEVDVRSVHSLVDFLIDGGVHGIFALGSTSEGPALTSRQRKTLLDATIAAVKGRVPVIAGIFDTSTARCIEHGLAAKAAGVDAVVLTATYYFQPGQPEIIDHFRAVRAAVGLPILAYDIPSAVNVKLEVDTLKTLAEAGTLIGVKDSSGNVDAFRELLMATRHVTFRAFTGSELLVDVCLQMGAHGSVPGLGNVFPAEYARLYELARAGDWAGAARIQERLLACFRDLISQGEPAYSFTASALGGFKVALKLKGAIANSRMAAPLHSFGLAEEERVADVLRRHGFL
jgi:4-hydroxy-tetrahydrodipicolinate synthase